MLRILSLTSAYPDREWRAAGNFVEHQLRALAARPDVEIRVVVPVEMPPPPHSPVRKVDLPNVETLHGLTVHRPRCSRPSDNSLRVGAMAAALIPTVGAIRRDFRFDLIHAEFFWPDGAVAMHLAKALGLPFSVKARGGDFERAATGASWARQQVMEAGTRATQLLAVSETLRSIMIGQGLAPEKIAVHRTGLDRKQFRLLDRSAAKAALKLKGPTILSVGNLIARKRVHLAIEAAALVPEATLVIVGGGPDRAALEQQVQALGIAPRVRFIGPLRQALMPHFYAAADATIHTAEWEGLSNVWVESLACGTPVITTDCGAARELIDRPAAGHVIAPEPATIARAFRALLADPPEPSQVASRVKGFSWERNAEELDVQLRSAKNEAQFKEQPC